MSRLISLSVVVIQDELPWKRCRPYHARCAGVAGHGHEEVVVCIGVGARGGHAPSEVICGLGRIEHTGDVLVDGLTGRAGQPRGHTRESIDAAGLGLGAHRRVRRRDDEVVAVDAERLVPVEVAGRQRGAILAAAATAA